MSESASRPVNRWLIFSLVAVGIFMCTLDGSIVNIALPVIMKDLDASLAAIEWVVLIYLLTITSLLLSFGRLSDIKGRRWVYTRGLLLFTTGSLLCATARTPLWLVASRLFQGVGAAMIMACTPAIVVDTFPVSERGRALGLMGAVVAAGLTAGPALGGFLIHHFSWRAIFFINLPIGIVAATAVHVLLKHTSSDLTRAETFDHVGAGLLALSLGPFLIALTHGYDWGYTSIRVWSLFSLSAIALAVLAVVEPRLKHPLLAPSLLKIRLFTLPLISAVLMFAGLFTIVFLIPFYLMNPGGYPENRAGYLMMTLFVALFFFAPLSGSLSDRIGSRMLCTLGMGILALAFLFLSQIKPAVPPLSLAWRLALAGTGIAVFLSPNSATIMNAVPPAHRGVAAGMVAAARNLGMVLGVALAGAMFNSTFYKLSGGENFIHYTPAIEPIFMIAFHRGIAAGGGVAVFGMIIAFLRGPESKQ